MFCQVPCSERLCPIWTQAAITTRTIKTTAAAAAATPSIESTAMKKIQPARHHTQQGHARATTTVVMMRGVSVSQQLHRKELTMMHFRGRKGKESMCDVVCVAIIF
mmetsp:Transcript_21230/g.29758  ORF Transcript_21230/g.29758 Transcript_21230/m.29758 type:complete len:106 (-) Transcript_21230:31-348(-)